MSVYQRPLALTDDGKRHEPMQPGRLLEPDVVPVSADKDNLITRGDDGLKLAAQDILSQTEQILSVTDNKLKTTLSLKLNSATNVLELLGTDNVVIGEVKLPVVPGLPVVAEILKNFTPPAMDYGEQPEGAYMHLQFQMSDGTVKDIYYNVSDFVDIYKGGDGIDVTDNTVSFVPEEGKGLGVHREGAYVKPAELVAQGEKVLQVVNDKFQTTLALEVDADANAIRLKGVDGAVVAEASLPPYSGAPSVVEVVENFTPPGLSKGTYLHMQFVRADGKTEDLYYSLEKVVDIFEAGNGIDITDKVISVKPEAGKGIAVSANGAAVAATDLVHEGEKIIGVADNAFYTQFSLVLDEDTNELICLGKDKQEVSRVKLPFGKGGAPTVFEYLYDFTPPPPHGAASGQQPRSNYLHMHFDMGGGDEEDIYLEVPWLAPWDRRIDGPLPEGKELEKLLAEMPVGGLVYFTEGGVNPVFLTPEEAVERYVSLTAAQSIAGVKTFEESPEAPTPPDGDESNKVATTQFVWDAITDKHSADGTLMRTNNNQTVTGVKTFSTSPLVPTPTRGDSSTKTANTAFVQDIKWSKTITGALPANPDSLIADMPVGALVHYDGDEAVQYLTPDAADARYVSLTANQTVAGTKTFSASPLVPTPNAQDSSQKAANTYFVQQWLATKVSAADFTSTLQSLTDALNDAMASKADDNGVVKLSGNQTIAGTKTFSASPVVPTAQAGDATQKVASTAFVTGAIAAAHASAPTLVRTAGDQTIDGVKTFLQAPVVPTQAQTDNSTKAASTAFVKTAIAALDIDEKNDVKLTGNQTIAGTKTFSSSPVVPTPTAGDNSQKVATTAFVMGIRQFLTFEGPLSAVPASVVASLPVGSTILYTE